MCEKDSQLDEDINHCEEVIRKLSCDSLQECAIEHTRLKGFLLELKSRRAGAFILKDTLEKTLDFQKEFDKVLNAVMVGSNLTDGAYKVLESLKKDLESIVKELESFVANGE